MAEEDPVPDDLPEPDGKPRLHAELAVAQAMNGIGLNWAHFQEDHEDEAAVLLDAATLAEAHYDDGLEEAAREVLTAWATSPEEYRVSEAMGDALEQLESALGEHDPSDPSDPSDDDLAAIPDAEAVGSTSDKGDE